jgi:hypothetical protein
MMEVFFRVRGGDKVFIIFRALLLVALNIKV